MGLAWQQGPLGATPSGQFLLGQPLPAHVPYPEPAAARYHRVDVRAGGRRLTGRRGGERVAGPRAPRAVLETGCGPRWYGRRRDVARGVLHDDPLRTLCPYKGVARYFHVVAGGRR